MLLYYITDRKQFPGSDAAQRRALLDRIAAAARAGVDYIQLREKDLPTRELEALAREAVALVRPANSGQRATTRLLVNSRTDVALAAGAAGVHLPAADIFASDARALAATPGLVVGVSCHTLDEVLAAEAHGADFAVFGPVFEKEGTASAGLAALRAACARGRRAVPRTEAGHTRPMPVLALGGVSLANAAACLRAGAAGLAGIRLFQQGDVAETITRLRALAAQTAGSRGAPAPGRAGVAEDGAELGSGGAPAPGREKMRARPAKLAYRRRLPHLQKPGHPVFVTFRTLGEFELDERCRTLVLQHCLHDNGVKLHMHAAVVMNTHVHLLFTPLEDALGDSFGLGEIVGGIKGASAHSINRLLSRESPVWQDEWLDHRIRSEADFDERYRYIELNAVEAHLVKTPSEYKWLWLEP